jgi:hypothetical protein
MRLWCSILENNQPLDSLFKVDLPADFLKIIDGLRTHSFNRQTEYLEKVFFIINKNDDTLIQNYLKKNEKTSLDWCNRFKVPIFPHRRLTVD